MECEIVSLDFFDVDSSILCGFNFLGNYIIYMFIIRVDRRYKEKWFIMELVFKKINIFFSLIYFKILRLGKVVLFGLEEGRVKIWFYFICYY